MTTNTATSPAQPTVILLHGLLRKAKCMEKLRKYVARHENDRAPPPPTASPPLALRYPVAPAQLYCMRDPRGMRQRSMNSEAL